MGPHRTLTFRLESLLRDRVEPGRGLPWLVLLCLFSGSCVLPPAAENKPLTGELDEPFQVDSTLAPGAARAVDTAGDTAASSDGGSALASDGGTAEERSRLTEDETAPVAATSTDPEVDEAPGTASMSPDEAPSTEPGTGKAGAADDSSGEGAGGVESVAERTVAEDNDPKPDGAATERAAVDPARSVIEVQESTGTDLTPVEDVTETVAAEAGDLDAQAGEGDLDVDRPAGESDGLPPKEDPSALADDEARSAASADRATTGQAKPETGQPGSANSDTDGGVTDPPPGRVAPHFPLRQHTTDDGFVMTYEVGGPPPQDASSDTPESEAIDRATIVFIHGWCGDGSQWRSHMEKLAADSVVLSLDLLGHGASRDAEERSEWTIPRYGGDVSGLIEAEDLNDVILVGHAMGGQVALEVALRLPDRITGVIGVESLHELNVDPTEPEDSELKDYVAAFENDFMAAFHEFINSAAHVDTPEPIRTQIEQDASGCDKEVAVKLIKHFQTRDLKSVVRNIECPVKCINSKIFKTDIEGNRALLTGFNVIELPGVGYWPHLEQPEAFRSALVDQINQIRAPKKPREPGAITQLLPVLFSDDIEALAEFYKSRLQFQPVDRLPEDPEQPATLISLERDDWRLQLRSRGSLAEEIPGAEDVAQGGRLLFFTVTNLAEEKRNLGQDLTFIHAARTLPSGAQETVFRDPQLNVIVLQQLPRQPAVLKDVGKPGIEPR